MGFQTRQLQAVGRPADLKIGDTAGLGLHQGAASTQNLRSLRNPDQIYQAASSGKIFANFTLERGLAIIGVTVSRHFA